MAGAFLPQQRLYFSPDLQGQVALRALCAVWGAMSPVRFVVGKSDALATGVGAKMRCWAE
jgi:hypothetical protein